MKYVNTDYVLKYATQKVILDLIIISNLICNNNEIFVIIVSIIIYIII